MPGRRTEEKAWHDAAKRSRHRAMFVCLASGRILLFAERTIVFAGENRYNRGIKFGWM